MKLSLLSTVDDYYKVGIIESFSLEKTKLEGIKLLKSDHSKANIIKSFNDKSLFEQGLALIDSDYSKRQLIMALDDDLDKYNLLKYIKHDSDKSYIISSLKDDLLKKNSLSTLSNDSDKARIISTLNSDEYKYELLSELSNEYYKVSVIASIKDEVLFVNAFDDLKNDSSKVNVLINLKEDAAKFKYLSLLVDDQNKVKVINSMSDEKFKVKSLSEVKDEKFRVEIIKSFKDEAMRLDFLSFLDSNENKFLVIASVTSDNLKNDALIGIDNYKEVMNEFFKKGNFELLYHFDKKILLDVFSEKDLVILKEYEKIKNDKIRTLFSNYVKSNYDNLNMKNIDKISKILSRIELSNSSELQAFGDLIASQVLNSKDPIKQFSKIEDIFVKNNIPYVGKVFEVFKLIHGSKFNYRNYSPLLNRFKDSNIATKMMDVIIFNDLLKCSFGSNNRNLKEFLFDIEKGNIILTNVMKNRSLLNVLDVSEKNALSKYLDRIEIILTSYDEWLLGKDSSFVNSDFNSRIDAINARLLSSGKNYTNIPDIITRKLCGVSGISCFKDA